MRRSLFDRWTVDRHYRCTLLRCRGATKPRRLNHAQFSRRAAGTLADPDGRSWPFIGPPRSRPARPPRQVPFSLIASRHRLTDHIILDLAVAATAAAAFEPRGMRRERRVEMLNVSIACIMTTLLLLLLLLLMLARALTSRNYAVGAVLYPFLFSLSRFPFLFRHLYLQFQA